MQMNSMLLDKISQGKHVREPGAEWLILVDEEEASFTRTNWNVSDKYDLDWPVPLTPVNRPILSEGLGISL